MEKLLLIGGSVVALYGTLYDPRKPAAN